MTPPKLYDLKRHCGGIALVLLLATTSNAHDGRRFDVQVVSGKLVAQGRNTGADDGAPIVRPYVNSIHDHWRDATSLNIATSFLPEYDVRQAVGQLVGYRLELDWIRAQKWVDPPMMPGIDTPIHLSPLDPGEVITLDGDYTTKTSDELGSLVLHPSIPNGGVYDMGFTHVLNHLSEREIHVLTFELSAIPVEPGLPELAPSDPLYVLLSPDGSDAATRLHHASLFLEQRITQIPEPSTVAILVAGLLTAAVVRSRIAR